MSARKMAKIAILSALCVAFRYAFSFLPNVQPISAIFFLIVIFEDLQTSLLVMAVTMFTSAFLLGMSPIVLFQLLSFGLILCLWRLLYPRLNLVGQGIAAALLSQAGSKLSALSLDFNLSLRCCSSSRSWLLQSGHSPAYPLFS